MKKKLKALVAMMSLCAVGAVGSAFAVWQRSSATGTGTTQSFDKAIYLYWGSGSSTASIGDIDNLSGGSTVYRYLTVSPKSTKSVSGTVTLRFNLAASTDCVITGLEVNVYKVAELPANDTAAAAAIAAIEADEKDEVDATLTPSQLEDTTTFSVSAGTAAHETQAFYVIAVSYDGTATGTLGGLVTINQSFNA